MMDNCNGFIYYIQRGDTLYSISRRYDIPLALIMRANPFVDIYNLQIGDAICIPGRRPGGNVTTTNYTVRPNETIQDVLDRFRIDWEELLRYNRLSLMYLLPGMILKIPSRRERDSDDNRDEPSGWSNQMYSDDVTFTNRDNDNRMNSGMRMNNDTDKNSNMRMNTDVNMEGDLRMDTRTNIGRNISNNSDNNH